MLVSVGQESRHGLIESSASGFLPRLLLWYWLRLWCHSEGSSREGLSPTLSHAVVGRIQFFGSCWIEGLNSKLAAGWRPPSLPWHTGFSNLIYHRKYSRKMMSGGKRERERENKMEVTVFYNLIVEVTFAFDYFCSILFVRSKPLGLTHTYGEGITQDASTGNWGLSKSILKGRAPPQWALKNETLAGSFLSEEPGWTNAWRGQYSIWDTLVLLNLKV